MTVCARSERRGGAAATRSTPLNPKHYPETAHSTRAVQQLELRSAMRSIQDDVTAATDHHQLSGTQFEDGLFRLQSLQVADFSFDDVRVRDDLVHGWLRPVKYVGLLAHRCSSRANSDAGRLSFQHQESVSRVHVGRVSYRSYRRWNYCRDSRR